MVVYLGGIDECVRQCMAEGSGGPGWPHPFPCCCLRRWHFTMTALRNITFCVLQFMIIKPCMTLLVLFLDIIGEYGDPRFHDWEDGYIYCTILYNLSVGVAFAALVYFAVATHERLTAHSPMLKFACIKGIVFLSFWQGIAIDFLHASGNLPVVPMYRTEQNTQAGLQDFLVCMEMLFFSVLHKFAFSADSAALALRRVPPVAPQGMGRAVRIVLRQDEVAGDFYDAWQWLHIRRHRGADAVPTRCHDAPELARPRTGVETVI